MTRAVCPGSFDPVTHGHLDIIARAAQLFEEVIVAVGVNQSKNRMFGPEERLEMLEQACVGFDNVRIAGFTGLVTTFCTEHNAQAIVKGLRAATDFDYEMPMAQMNAALTNVQTVFLPTATGTSFVSSSLVKEVAAFGGDVSGFVPPFVLERLALRLAER